MEPVLTDECPKRIQILDAQCFGHLECKRLHSRQAADNSRPSFAVCIAHKYYGVCGNARFARVHNDRSLREREATLCGKCNLIDFDCITEVEQLRAAEGGGVVVLIPTWNTEFFYLDISTERGQSVRPESHA